MKSSKPTWNTDDEKLDSLMRHYMRGRWDMDTRRTRKNGWNEVISAYMGKLPANWPFLSVVVDPRIRTSIVEKDARLINAKLRGRLVPRSGGSVIKSRIHNALLDFQWDFANTGGSMLEKVALVSQLSRLFGAGFALTYWDTKRDTNEIKVIDPRDIFWDGAATHARNARWCQVREFTTWDSLAARGFKVKELKQMAEKGEITSQWKSTSYESIVKANRGLMDRTGEPDDNPKNPIVEVITEWTPTTMDIFLPRFGKVLQSGPNPYKHQQIPVAQLRYHPLIDDIYGETDAEYTLPLQRAINATLCGFIDEMTITNRPPLKISSVGVRTETIEYGPGAQWVMDNPNLVQEMQFSPQVISNFNATYPALVAAFNTAWGDSSLGVSNVRGEFTSKTATEVQDLAQQQNTRDQSDQNYLAEFLKDIMMMWLSNNKQYLFDDPSKAYKIIKVIGKEDIQYFQQMKLDGTDVPPEAIDEIKQTIQANPEAVTPQMIDDVMKSVSVPTNPVVLNPNEKNPANMQVVPKLDLVNNEEANLYLTPDDFDGEYEYIPDVTSMAAGASKMSQQAKQQALALTLNPITNQLLAQQGEQIDIKGILIDTWQDAGMRDAEALFKPVQQNPMMGGAQNVGQNPNLGPGQGAPQSGGGVNFPNPQLGMGGVSSPVPNQPVPRGLSQTNGIPG